MHSKQIVATKQLRQQRTISKAEHKMRFPAAPKAPVAVRDAHYQNNPCRSIAYPIVATLANYAKGAFPTAIFFPIMLSEMVQSYRSDEKV